MGALQGTRGRAAVRTSSLESYVFASLASGSEPDGYVACKASERS